MKYKILITEPIHSKANTLLKKQTQIIQPISFNNDLVKIVKENQVDGIIVRANIINRDVIQASKNLKVIVKHGVGYNNIDIGAAKKLHIPVLYTPDANFESVAEFVVGLLYLLVKKYSSFDQELRIRHNWDKNKYQTIELQNKYLGLIGLGRIGRRVADLVSPLNMGILGYDPHLPSHQFPVSVTRVMFLDELLKKSDFVSIHCPSNKETHHMIAEDEFKKMKKSAYLINTARGDIIKETAIIKALKNHWIAGMAIDTFGKEPPDLSGELFNLDNLIVTPHVAGTARESFIRMGLSSAELILKILNNKINEINDEYFVVK